MIKRQTNFKTEFLPFDTYKWDFRKSAEHETLIYQTVYINNELGKKVDDTEGGNLSCAYFVYAKLILPGIITNSAMPNNEPVLWVKDLEKILLDSSFVKIKKPRVGAVVFWGPEGPRKTRHVGIYNGRQKIRYNAISKLFYTKKGAPVYYSAEEGRFIDGQTKTIPTAISNNDKLRRPIIHHLNYLGLFGRKNKRKITAIYWMPYWDRCLGLK